MKGNPSSLLVLLLFLSHHTTTTTTTTSAKTEDVEGLFVKERGNYPFSFTEWETARGWYKEKLQKRLKEFCTAVHETAGHGEDIVDTVVIDTNRLIFANEKYKARDVTTLTYGINGTLWYLTESVREDCVYYLELTNVFKMQFKLQKKVCDVKPLGMWIPPHIPDPMED